jgi:hypothetical protein
VASDGALKSSKFPASGGVPPALRAMSFSESPPVPSIQFTVIWVCGVKFCGVVLANHCARPVGFPTPA